MTNGNDDTFLLKALSSGLAVEDVESMLSDAVLLDIMRVTAVTPPIIVISTKQIMDNSFQLFESAICLTVTNVDSSATQHVPNKSFPCCCWSRQRMEDIARSTSASIAAASALVTLSISVVGSSCACSGDGFIDVDVDVLAATVDVLVVSLDSDTIVVVVAVT